MRYNTRVKSRVVFFFLCLLTIVAFQPSQVQARYGWCRDSWDVDNRNKIPSEINGGETVTLNLEGMLQTKTYEVYLYKWYTSNDEAQQVGSSFTNVTTKTLIIGDPLTNKNGDYDINLKDDQGNWCTLAQFKIKNSQQCTVIVSQAGQKDTQCVDVDGGPITVHVENMVFDGGKTDGKISFEVTYGPGGTFIDGVTLGQPQINVVGGKSAPFTLRVAPTGERPFTGWKVRAVGNSTFIPATLCSSKVFKRVQTCSDDQRKKSNLIVTENFKICNQISTKNTAARTACEMCVGTDVIPRGMWTAIGCIPTSPTSIIRTIMTVGLSVAGGVALLQLLTASFLFTTSQGDPKQHTDAKEKLGSALTGLLFIIFAITILQFIGVSVFRIPGFGG